MLPKLQQARQAVRERLADLPPADFTLETGLKPYRSIKRKMETDHAKKPEDLSDLARGRLFFSEQFQQEHVLDLLKRLFGTGIGTIEDKAKCEHGLEYHGIVHVNLNLDGQPFELQVLPMEYKPHRQFLHGIYERFRDPKRLEKLTPERKETLSKIHNDMYQKLHEQALKNRSDQ